MHRYYVFPLITLLAAFPGPGAALDFNSWLHNLFLPRKGATLKDEIQCYNLPYGGVGFISHVLTYYTTTMLLFGRTALFPRPGDRLTHSYLDLILGSASLLGTLPVTVLTMVSCHSRWQFVLIAVWKLALSLTMSVITFHASIFLMRGRKGDAGLEYTGRQRIGVLDGQTYRRTLQWWLVVYALGTVVGLVGVINLAIEVFTHIPNVQLITKVFGAVAGTPLLGVLAFYAGAVLFKYGSYYLRFDHELDWSSSFWHSGLLLTFWGVVWFGALGIMYCDWVLAAIAGNWWGIPSGEIALLYWTYFMFKRLPMLSM
jgi:hypothetical protein